MKEMSRPKLTSNELNFALCLQKRHIKSGDDDLSLLQKQDAKHAVKSPVISFILTE